MTSHHFTNVSRVAINLHKLNFGHKRNNSIGPFPKGQQGRTDSLGRCARLDKISPLLTNSKAGEIKKLTAEKKVRGKKFSSVVWIIRTKIKASVALVSSAELSSSFCEGKKNFKKRATEKNLEKIFFFSYFYFLELCSLEACLCRMPLKGDIKIVFPFFQFRVGKNHVYAKQPEKGALFLTEFMLAFF